MVSTPFIAAPPHDYGGTELIVHELVEGLAARGHAVTVYATADSRSSAQLRALYDAPRWPPDLLTEINHVTWAFGEIARESVDVVHAHSASALAAARLLPGVPLIYTLHHEAEPRASEYYRHFPDAHFVAISADQRSREPGVERCAVVHHGLDPLRFACADRPGEYLAFVGRLSPVKGPHTAIDVARASGLPIRVAGPTHAEDRTFARRELRHRLTQPHVTYVEAVTQAEKRPLLRDARALLAPVEWNEPFGLILIEAMLSGCPVVAFPRGSVPEIVEEGITGFLVNTPAEMVRVLRQGGPLDSFDRRRCRRRAVERFSRARMVRDYERLYQAVAVEAPAAPASRQHGARRHWSRSPADRQRGPIPEST